VFVNACNQRFDFDIPAAGGESGSSAGGAPGGSGPSAGSGGVVGGTGCAGDDDCGLESLHCDLASASCVECLNDAHCAPLGLTRCDGAIHRCVECGVDFDCPAEGACDPASRRCLQRCREDVDCAADEGCASTRGVCYECDDDDECERSLTGSHCVRESGLCVVCERDEDCAGLYCDPVTRNCVECRHAADCGAGRVCDPSDHRCVSL
jgi:hypothetical protein